MGLTYAIPRRFENGCAAMSHHHNHNEHCGDDAHDHDHDHGDAPDELGAKDNLFGHIDIQNVVALNAIGEGHTVIKPWDQRTSEAIALESDADDQMYALYKKPTA
jgi:hypothetical protein